ncbi:PilW family protein [Massilia sp. TS11]|uniref:PilW family protein n=1 Tax=Massilia sp. TS11 TaxID=2908003 RepID=UPI001EDA97DD|nr:PilW family protein [Massilia sp. TS11]MCG2583814.1 PilW family protein [Massilia sp. TS11]
MKRIDRGFSIAELLVAVAIGLLALIFATGLVGNVERNKNAQLGGSDALQNGMLALFSLSRDAEQAGWGLNDPLVVGCDTLFSDTQGYALPSVVYSSAAGVNTTVTPLSPVLIVNNGARPDRISFQSGSNLAGTAMLRVVSAYAGGTSINVDRNPYGFAEGDVIVVMPETRGASQCAIGQVSSLVTPPAPGQNQVLIASGSAYRYNSGNLGTTYAANQARLFNLGRGNALGFRTWSVSAGGFLQLRAADVQGAAAAAVTVTDNIVGLKAQYGFDTRAGAAFTPENGMVISQWSASLIDADGDGAIDANDVQRIAAVRLAVVARGSLPQRVGAGQPCTATPNAITVFSSAQPDGVTAVPVTLDVRISGDPVDWHCYRYRSFETIIPLRNASWRPNA